MLTPSSKRRAMRAAGIALDRLEPRMLLSAYAIVDLGTLGGAASNGFDINDTNQVVGWAQTATGVNRAFRFQDLNSNNIADSGEMENLGVLAGFTQSYAHGINNSGEVVGSVVSAANVKKAVKFQPGGNPTDLGLGNGSNAYAINMSGTVVGAATFSNRYLAFKRTSAGAVTELGSLGAGGQRYSEAMNINDQGVITGYSSTAAGDSAFIVNAAPMAAIGFASQPAGLEYGYGWDINNSGQIAGEGFNSAGEYRAFRYFAGQASDLSIPVGYTSSQGFGINDVGQVVGALKLPSNATRAFLYSNGAIHDLNDLIPVGSGWTLTQARAINDAGYIVGTGTNSLSQTHAFLLVPGPATIAVSGDAGGIITDDHIIVRRSAIDPAVVEVFVNSPTPTSMFQASDAAKLVIDTGDGNDTVEFDFSNGAPLPLAGAAVNGQAGTLDTLRILGASTRDEVNVTSTTVEVGAGPIEYATVERLLLDTDGGDDLVTLGSGLAPDLLQIGVDAGSGDDRIELAGTPPVLPVIAAGDGSDQLVLSGGTHALGADLASISVESLSLANDAIASAGASQSLTSVSVSGQARLSLVANGTHFLRTAALVLADQAVLDLAANNLIIDAGFMQTTVLQSVTAWIASARNALTPWSGPGITSSIAGITPRTGLAAIANVDRLGGPVRGSLEGQPVGQDAVLVKYTWDGDANLDGLIDIDDYFLADTGLALALAGYANGDFDYDLFIDADDFFLIDLAYLQQTGPLAATNAVPAEEPDLFAEQMAPPSVF